MPEPNETEPLKIILDIKKCQEENNRKTDQIYTALVGLNGKGGLLSQVSKNTKMIITLSVIVASMIGLDKLAGVF